MAAKKPWNGRPYRRAHAKFKAQRFPCYVHGPGCILYDLTGRDAQTHPRSFTVQHRVPLSRGGELMDRDNWLACCRSANSALGNRTRDEFEAKRNATRRSKFTDMPRSRAW